MLHLLIQEIYAFSFQMIGKLRTNFNQRKTFLQLVQNYCKTKDIVVSLLLIILETLIYFFGKSAAPRANHLLHVRLRELCLDRVRRRNHKTF